MTARPEVAAIVLAAGQASRWRDSGGDSTKLVADWKGEPMVRRAARAALASRARPAIVVTGADSAAVRAALAGLDLVLVDNPRFAEGIATSLAAGLAAVPHSADGAVVLLGDMPEVGAALIDNLIAAFAAAPQAKAVVPVVAGERGNPALLARALFDPARALQGDAGARRLIAAAGDDVVELCVNEHGARLDIDTVEALRNAGREGEV
ncbi:MAG: nucleotidyltransferase family protein [Methylobacteriaceae bacterium]|nr:nucleotidyltransferase family protein [Methylobacteriaceae bacterium]